jgi:hypothetical protein
MVRLVLHAAVEAISALPETAPMAERLSVVMLDLDVVVSMPIARLAWVALHTTASLPIHNGQAM